MFVVAYSCFIVKSHDNIVVNGGSYHTLLPEYLLLTTTCIHLSCLIYFSKCHSWFHNFEVILVSVVMNKLIKLLSMHKLHVYVGTVSVQQRNIAVSCYSCSVPLRCAESCVWVTEFLVLSLCKPCTSQHNVLKILLVNSYNALCSALSPCTW